METHVAFIHNLMIWLLQIHAMTWQLCFHNTCKICVNMIARYGITLKQNFH